MFTAALVSFAALALAPAQVVQGSNLVGPGCTSLLGGTPLPVSVVTTNIGAVRNAALEEPKQGEAFMIFLNVTSQSQPCATSLTVRPGFKLPPGLTFAPAASPSDLRPVCRMGSTAQNATNRACPLQPTEVLFDGTLMFDAPSGLWSIPSGQTLQIQIPVRGQHTGQVTAQGYLDYVAFNGFYPALRPSVNATIFYNPPSIALPTPAVTSISAFGAHVFGAVDPHHNAGIVGLQLARGDGAFETIEQAELGSEHFIADVDSVLEDLDADTTYRFRFTFLQFGYNFPLTGPETTFRTLPAPRVAFSATVTGAGRIDSSLPTPNSTLPERAVVTLTARAEAGHRLVRFVVDGVTQSGDSATLTVAGPVVAVATFEPIPPPPAPPADDEEEPTVPGDDTEVPGDNSEVPSDDTEVPGDDTEVPGDEEEPAVPGDDDATGDDRNDEDSDGPTSGGIGINEDVGDPVDLDIHGGCAAVPPALFPFFLVLLAFRRRR